MGTIVEVSTARCGIAPKLAGDGRGGTTELAGNLADTVSASSRQSDLFALGE
jgi:hypothetical protein